MEKIQISDCKFIELSESSFYEYIFIVRKIYQRWFNLLLIYKK